MKSTSKNTVPNNNQRGGVIVLVAVFMTFVFGGIAALAIDIGYRNTTKNELQNVADAAALAGAAHLGNEYIQVPPSELNSKTFTRSEVVAIVKNIAEQNKAAGLGITIDDTPNDIQIGNWNQNTLTVDVASDSGGNLEPIPFPDAVRVVARRDNSPNSSPISTFFANIFDIETMSVEAEATASIDGSPSVVAEGELITPFALSEHVFNNQNTGICSELISFSPTTESCAAWHNFFDPINANNMDDKLIGFIEGDVECEFCGLDLLNGPDWIDANFNINPGQMPDPAVTPAAGSNDGTMFEFQGGTIASLFQGDYLDTDYDGNGGTVLNNDNESQGKRPAPMIALFDYFRYRDGDGDNTIWTATIPIYKDAFVYPSCMNPNTSLEIVDYADIEIIRPQEAPENNIVVRVDCDKQVIDGRAGGGLTGRTVSTVPNLVK